MAAHPAGLTNPKKTAGPQLAQVLHLLGSGIGRENHDGKILVELSNGVTSSVQRTVDYVHLPVPKHCTGDEYFLPFRDYQGPDDTRIYVGLIHHDDAAGDKQRIETAARFIRNMGVATECGWGRADPETVDSLLTSHRLAAEALAGMAE